MTVLGVLETEPGGGAADASLRALAVAGALAASAGEDLAAAWFGPVGAVDRGGLAAAGVARGWAIGPDELSGYAPLAWARALAGLASAGSSGSAAGPPGGGGPVSAVVAAATDHGNEVLAHLGAITGLPMAANCVSATRTGPGECRLVRQRWAGSLLEDAVLEAPLALLTVATDAVEAPAAGGQDDGRSAAAGIGVERYEPELADGDLLVRAVESQQRRSGVSLASARVVVGGGRGVGGPEGFAALEELAGLLGAAVGVSRVVTSEGDPAHGRLPGRQDDRGDQHRRRSPDRRQGRLRGHRGPARGDPRAARGPTRAPGVTRRPGGGRLEEQAHHLGRVGQCPNCSGCVLAMPRQS